MGRTSKPLVLAVEETIDGPTFEALRAQGHTIQVLAGQSDIDLYLGPRCWRLEKEVAENPKLLEVALKQAREIKYNVENKKAYTGQDAPKPTKANKGRPPKKPKSSRILTESAVRSEGTVVQQDCFSQDPNLAASSGRDERESNP